MDVVIVVVVLVVLFCSVQGVNSGMRDTVHTDLPGGTRAASQLVTPGSPHSLWAGPSDTKETGNAEQSTGETTVSPVASKRTQTSDITTSQISSQRTQTSYITTSQIASQRTQTKETTVTPVATLRTPTRETTTSQHTQTRKTTVIHHTQRKETTISLVADDPTRTRETPERRVHEDDVIEDDHEREVDDGQQVATELPFPSAGSPSRKQRALTTRELDCDAALCKKKGRFFVINTRFCAEDTTTTIFMKAKSSYTVTVSTDPTSTHTPTVCLWHVNLPYKTLVNVTVGRLVGGNITRKNNLSLTISYVRRINALLERPDDLILAADGATLAERSVSVVTTSQEDLSDYPSATRPMRHRLRYDSALPGLIVTLHYVTVAGVRYVRGLPFVNTSDTTGFVMTPGFDTGQKDRSSFYWEFKMSVADAQSLLFAFRNCSLCNYVYWDSLRIWVDDVHKDLYDYRVDLLRLSVAQSSLRLLLFRLSDDYGFKMILALVPRSHAPQWLLGKLINCSVAHFSVFQPFVTCNSLVECHDAEDERDCPYAREEDGPDTICTGTQCYRFVGPLDAFSWYDAQYHCLQSGQTLASLTDAEDFRVVRQLYTDRARQESSFFVGLHLLKPRAPEAVAQIYNGIWQWSDGRPAFSFLNVISGLPSCSMYMPNNGNIDIQTCHTKNTERVGFICEWEKRGTLQYDYSRHEQLMDTEPTNLTWKVSVVKCRLGHVTRDFLSCDALAQCGAVEAQRECSAEGVTLPMFACQGGGATVPFSLVCDHVTHCPDKSDEDFCLHPACPHNYVRCPTGQCFHYSQICDGKVQCFDWTDEPCKASASENTDNHLLMEDGRTLRITKFVLPPGVVYLTGMETQWIKEMNATDDCPDTHFQCPGDFCLPRYLRCNGVEDCRGRQDEMGCDSYTCHGLYRCRGSRVCLHADDVCDGVPQCPQQDDELLCDMSCPDACRCQGLAFVCSLHFSARSYADIRYLDASGSAINLMDVSENWYLVHLRLSQNGINNVPSNLTLPNLKDLDLSWNQLRHIDMQRFTFLGNLKVLKLTANPVVHVTNSQPSPLRNISLEQMVLSLTDLNEYDGGALSSNPLVRVLNFSGSKLQSITKKGFQNTPKLETIDVRDTFLKDFPADLLRNLAALKEVHADNYKLCCQAMLPVDFKPRNCHAPHDLLTSCEDLLRSNTYRVFLWVLGCLSIVGNAGSFVGRVYLQRGGDKLSSFSVFVTNLCVADFLMGVYLAVIGVADQVFHGRYLWYDDEWKQSVACQMAGFLSLLSSETSAFVICLITLDRVLVLRFPFSRFHFRRRSAIVTSAVVWAACLCLAAVPLLPGVRHWGFYSQTGICIPLPFSGRGRFVGYDYSLGVMVLLNLTLFVLIAAGQVVIYRTVLTNTVSSTADHKTRDTTIARRLSTVVVSDFLCWFPVGLLGLLAATGTPIPGEVNVAVAIFVLPLNAALNPFLYTFNILMEKRRKVREAILTQKWEIRLQMDLGKVEARRTFDLVNKAAAVDMTKAWLGEQLFSLGDITH